MNSSTERIVHLVDSDETTLKSVSFLLRELGYVVTCYGSLDELLSAGNLDAGCVLFDLHQPAANGKAPDWLRSLRIGLPVIVMSGSSNVATAVEALKGGAADFIEKPFTKSVLLDALGAAVLKPGNDALAGSEEARRRLETLTPREWDVLRCLSRGCANKVIAYELGISPRTVEIHRAHMMNKLGVRSLSHALRLAFAAGLGSDPGESRAVTDLR